MRKIYGLENLRQQHSGILNVQRLAQSLLDDLSQCRCTIYGCIGDDDRIVLARLDLLPESLAYEAFDRRIDLTVAGPILRADCVPLTYELRGKRLVIAGRCSVIYPVCGVDLYLQRGYTGVVGDIGRQKFAIPVMPLWKTLSAA